MAEGEGKIAYVMVVWCDRLAWQGVVGSEKGGLISSGSGGLTVEAACGGGPGVST